MFTLIKYIDQFNDQNFSLVMDRSEFEVIIYFEIVTFYIGFHIVSYVPRGESFYLLSS